MAVTRHSEKSKGEKRSTRNMTLRPGTEVRIKNSKIGHTGIIVNESRVAKGYYTVMIDNGATEMLLQRKEFEVPRSHPMLSSANDSADEDANEYTQIEFDI